MTFDIVSLVYNRQKDVPELLASIEAQTKKPHKVWLIDNGSSVPLTVDSSAYSFPIEIRRIEVNVGIAGYNEGFKRSEADFVIAVDSDVTLDQRAVEFFIDSARKISDLEFAGAQILDSATREVMFDNPIHGSKSLPGGGHQMVQFNGCCFMARRETFLSLGGFDQRLFIYVNEWDLTLRAFSLLRRDQIRYFPSIVAYHKTSASKDRSMFYEVLVRRNEFWIRWKYYPIADALNYSLRFYWGSLRRMASKRGRNFSLFGRYVISGTLGLRWALKERKALPRETFRFLMDMRQNCTAPGNVVENH